MTVSSILAVLSTALPIIKMVLETLIKTPEEKLGKVKDSILRSISEVQDGVKHLEENPGDTSKLEDAFNRSRRRNK